MSCQSRSVELESEVKYDTEAQTITIKLQQELAAGNNAAITLTYSGVLGDHPMGIFLAKYEGDNGQDEYIMASQMQPIDCRRAFPCFDEPALKATFDVSLTADRDLTCISNMDPTSVTEHDSGKKTVAFRRTPLMSTYLLAFVVGRLNMIETQAFRVPVRTYATPNQTIEDTRQALELGAKALAYFEKQFGIEYPLPKMDMVAVPTFLGAMENWGLAIYMENWLVYNEATGDVNTKKFLVITVMHELAHQWFGNLVTMDFWDGMCFLDQSSWL